MGEDYQKERRYLYVIHNEFGALIMLIFCQNYKNGGKYFEKNYF